MESESALASAGAPIHVLLVGDPPGVRESVRRSLKSAGCECEMEVAADWEQFRQLAATRSYDLVLCNSALTGFSSRDAVRWFRGAGSDVPFILLAGDTNDVMSSRLPAAILQALTAQAGKRESAPTMPGIIHDFNNVLTVIRGCSELLHLYKDDPERVEKYARQIKEATGAVASLLRSLNLTGPDAAPEPGARRPT